MGIIKSCSYIIWNLNPYHAVTIIWQAYSDHRCLAPMVFHTFRSPLYDTYFKSCACSVNLRLSIFMFLMNKLHFEHKYGLGKLKSAETRFSGGVDFTSVSFFGPLYSLLFGVSQGFMLKAEHWPIMVYFYKLLFGWRVVSLALTPHLPISTYTGSSEAQNLQK